MARGMTVKLFSNWISGPQLLAGTKSNPKRFVGGVTLTQGHQNGRQKVFSSPYIIHEKFERNDFKDFRKVKKSVHPRGDGGGGGRQNRTKTMILPINRGDLAI